MKNLLVLLMLSFTPHVHAQDFESVTVMSSKNDLNVYGFAKTNPDTIAMTTLCVEYSLTYLAQPELAAKRTEWRLLVGKDQTRFYSKMYESCDSVVSDPKWDKMFPMTTALIPVGEVYRDRGRKTLTVLQRMPFEKNNMVKYEEPSPDFEWTMEPGVDTLYGYACNRASTEYGGRKWAVLYTPQIPVNAGPWKLDGLPGLILQARDETGSYLFSMTRFEQIELPIICYIMPFREMTKEKWLKTECGFHGMPIHYFGNNGKNLFYEKGSQIQLGTSWSVVYNPIEWPTIKKTEAEKVTSGQN